MINFTKMHGIGNDFVVLNAMAEKLPGDLNKFSRDIAKHHFGIGADQIIIIDKSNIADFRMRIFNNEGGEAEMCGNGIQCMTKYVIEKGLTKKKALEVETLAGIIKPVYNEKTHLIKVNMGEPRLKTNDWFFEDKTYINKELEVEGEKYDVTLVSMGNPHCVTYFDEIKDLKLAKIGPKFEHHEYFPNRINTEFVKIISRKEIDMRVWERGTGETLACGTAASAVIVASVLNGFVDRKVLVHLLGGDLNFEWREQDNCVYLEGLASEVFKGSFDYPLR